MATNTKETFPTANENPDRKRMEAVARQDRTAFSHILAQYRPLVERTAFQLLGNHADAEDTAQDVFVKLWLNASRYKPEYRLSTWLYRITCNICYDRLRRKNRFRLLVRTSEPEQTRLEKSKHIHIEELGQEQPSAEDLLMADEAWNLFGQLTQNLSPKQKSVFILKEIEELPTEEIAFITGLTPEQIKSNLYQARQTIRRRFESYYAEPKTIHHENA